MQVSFCSVFVVRGAGDFSVLAQIRWSHDADKLESRVTDTLTAELSQGMGLTETKTHGSKVSVKKTLKRLLFLP